MTLFGDGETCAGALPSWCHNNRVSPTLGAGHGHPAGPLRAFALALSSGLSRGSAGGQRGLLSRSLGCPRVCSRGVSCSRPPRARACAC